MEIRELPPALKKLAERELNEDEKQLEKDVHYVTEWLGKQPHICARIDQQWLVGFLRGCKHSLERTKEKLETYHTIRTHLPEMFTGRDPADPKIQEILDLGSYLPLPTTETPESPRIVLVRGAIFDPSKYTFLEMARVYFMIMDLLVLGDDRLGVAGQDTLLDLTGSTLEHTSLYTPAIVKKVLTCFQDAYPIRSKTMHYINTPVTFDMIYSIFKMFMKEKLKKRVMIHADMESLFKYLPRKVLPSDYGGEGPSIATLTAEWKQKVIDNREWFLEDEKYRVDESKRQGKSVSGFDLFGVDGSFKQLNID
ncbi:retinol-binding protein pinta [Orussus abietinus]|uniref:retinol-binding protein pinta n=1 Tax=Orussus abietinus TaxID=222816 RepID=UPI000626836F|nr:retinol-binding protein pinta [Orussus abietinus]XP_023290810.1 retinol-binding protein pinta [Orussus abietinus]